MCCFFISLNHAQPINRLFHCITCHTDIVPCLDNVISELVQFIILLPRLLSDLLSGRNLSSITIQFTKVFVIKLIFFVLGWLAFHLFSDHFTGGNAETTSLVAVVDGGEADGVLGLEESGGWFEEPIRFIFAYS